MTKLLEQAIAKLKTRPISEQDSLLENLPSLRDASRTAIAALILEELQEDDDLGFSADRFRESWKQAVAGNTLPLSQLWEGSEVD
jgi:hypothetical protein